MKTIPIYARLPKADVDAIDKAAASQSVPVSRSKMLAVIVRAWAKKQAKVKR